MRHGAADFTKNLADAGGYCRHDRAGRHGHKASHERIFDEILASAVLNQLSESLQLVHKMFLSVIVRPLIDTLYP